MVYIKEWTAFQQQALELVSQRPERARYLVKAHPGRQWLILKVTDDNKTLKYRSRSTVILNRLEALGRSIASLTSGPLEGMGASPFSVDESPFSSLVSTPGQTRSLSAAQVLNKKKKKNSRK